MGSLLEVEAMELRIDFHQVLTGLTFQVGKNEIVAMVGENGSGKTMTLRSVIGLEETKLKKLEFHGRDISGKPPHARVKEGLSYCPSEAHLFPKMTVRENLEMGKYLYPEESNQGIQSAYELFPVLKDRANQEAAKLSGGEQQMLALTKSLMNNPDLLMLDEFSLGLTRKIALDFTEKVKEIYRSGVSVLFVEQNLQLASELAHRDYYIVEGGIEGENVLQ